MVVAWAALGEWTDLMFSAGFSSLNNSEVQLGRAGWKLLRGQAQILLRWWRVWERGREWDCPGWGRGSREAAPALLGQRLFRSHRSLPPQRSGVCKRGAGKPLRASPGTRDFLFSCFNPNRISRRTGRCWSGATPDAGGARPCHPQAAPGHFRGCSRAWQGHLVCLSWGAGHILAFRSWKSVQHPRGVGRAERRGQASKGTQWGLWGRILRGGLGGDQQHGMSVCLCASRECAVCQRRGQ